MLIRFLPRCSLLVQILVLQVCWVNRASAWPLLLVVAAEDLHVDSTAHSPGWSDTYVIAKAIRGVLDGAGSLLAKVLFVSFEGLPSNQASNGDEMVEFGEGRGDTRKANELQTRIKLGQSLLSNGDALGALSACALPEMVPDKSPELVDALICSGEARLKLFRDANLVVKRGRSRDNEARLRLARIDFESAIELDPTSPHARAGLGLSLLLLANIPTSPRKGMEIEAGMGKVSTTDVGLPVVTSSANTGLLLGQREELLLDAVMHFTTAASTVSKTEEDNLARAHFLFSSWYNTAVCYLYLRNNSKALLWLRRAINELPQSNLLFATTLGIFGGLLTKNENHEEAIQLLTVAKETYCSLESSSSPSSSLLEGEGRNTLGHDFDEDGYWAAFYDRTVVRRTDVTCSILSNNLGVALEAYGVSLLAAAVFEEATATDRQLFIDALGSYETALMWDPNNAIAMCNRDSLNETLYLAEAKTCGDALCSEKAILSRQGDEIVQDANGEAVNAEDVDSEGNSSERKPHARQFSPLRSSQPAANEDSSWDTPQSLADTDNKSRELEVALEALEFAASKNPQHSRIWIGLSRARSQGGDTTGAVEAAAKALRVASGHAKVEAATATLEDALRSTTLADPVPLLDTTQRAVADSQISGKTIESAELSSLRFDRERQNLMLRALEKFFLVESEGDHQGHIGVEEMETLDGEALPQRKNVDFKQDFVQKDMHDRRGGQVVKLLEEDVTGAPEIVLKLEQNSTDARDRARDGHAPNMPVQFEAVTSFAASGETLVNGMEATLQFGNGSIIENADSILERSRIIDSPTVKESDIVQNRKDDGLDALRPSSSHSHDLIDGEPSSSDVTDAGESWGHNKGVVDDGPQGKLSNVTVNHDFGDDHINFDEGTLTKASSVDSTAETDTVSKTVDFPESNPETSSVDDLPGPDDPERDAHKGLKVDSSTSLSDTAVSSAIYDDDIIDFDKQTLTEATGTNNAKVDENERRASENAVESIEDSRKEKSDDENLVLPQLFTCTLEDPQEPSAVATSYMKIADAYLDKQKFLLASKQFAKVMKKSPNHLPAIIGYATSLERLDKDKRLGEVSLLYANATRVALSQGQGGPPSSDRGEGGMAEAFLRRAVDVAIRVKKDDRVSLLRTLSNYAHTYVLAADIYCQIGREILGTDNPELRKEARKSFEISNGLAKKINGNEGKGHGRSMMELGRMSHMDGDASEALNLLTVALDGDLDEEEAAEAKALFEKLNMASRSVDGDDVLSA